MHTYARFVSDSNHFKIAERVESGSATLRNGRNKDSQIERNNSVYATVEISA